MKFPSKTSVLAEVRRSMGDKFNPDWVEEAITAAAAVPYEEDETYLLAVCAATQGVLKARLAAMNAATAERDRQSDEMAAKLAAFRAAWAAEDALREMPTSDTVQ